MISLFRNLIVRDFWLKLFSLALAILIWIIVSPAAQHQQMPLNSPFDAERTFFDVPVLVVTSAADARDFKLSPNEVEVTVRGDPKVLEKITAGDIRALVDLTGVESAQNLRKQIEVTVPAGVSIEAVVPKEVEVTVPPKQ